LFYSLYVLNVWTLVLLQHGSIDVVLSGGVSFSSALRTFVSEGLGLYEMPLSLSAEMLAAIVSSSLTATFAFVVALQLNTKHRRFVSRLSVEKCTIPRAMSTNCIDVTLCMFVAEEYWGEHRGCGSQNQIFVLSG